MKAIVFKEVKAPIYYGDFPDPIATSEQVIVNIKAAALNHRDVWITHGLYGIIEPDIVQGSCGAGVYNGQEVIINPNVNWGPDPDYPEHKDYRILGMPIHGTFAEQIAVHKDRLVEKPAHLTIEEAGALPLAGLTAYRALFTKARASANDKILINGIGGGVALMAFQFAVAIGAEVYVTSSDPEKIKKAIALGAKGGAIYTEDKWHKNLGAKVDVVIDSAGGKGFSSLMKACNPRARIAIYGGTRGNSVVNPQLLFWKELEIYGSTMGNDKEFQEMIDLINKYKIRPVVDSVYQLSEAETAYARMSDGKQFGKIVFKV